MAKMVAPHEQSVAGALFQTMTQVCQLSISSPFALFSDVLGLTDRYRPRSHSDNYHLR